MMNATTINKHNSPIKKIVYSFLLLFSLSLCSYKGFACSANFTFTAGINGHYTFTSTSTGVGSGTLYQWNAGDGSGWQNGSTTFSHVFISNNTFNVKLWIWDSTSCNDSITIPITVSNVTTPCILSPSYTYTVEPNGVVDFTSTSTGTNANTLYYWNAGDSNKRYPGTTTFTHQYAHVGGYDAWLILSDTGNAYCIDSIPYFIDVTTSDSAFCTLRANFTYTTGPNGEVTIISTSTGTVSWDDYIWNTGDTTGEHYGQDSLQYKYLFNGTYMVTLFIDGDTTSCSDSITLPVTITNACNMAVSFTYTYDSAGQVKFTSTSQGVNSGTQYYWTMGDSTARYSGSDTTTHAFPFIGVYPVELVIVNSGGCTDSVTEWVSIYNKDSLQACFIYSPDSLHTGGYNFTSTSRGTNVNTYFKWTPGDGNPADSGIGMNTYEHIYSLNGPYSATLEIWYTILPVIIRSHSPGRYDESSYTLVINVTSATGIPSILAENEYTIYPNPNNGLFLIAVNGLAGEKNAEIRISNMVGQMIYDNKETVANGRVISNVNLPDVKDGIYLLQVITADKVYNSKIIVQK